MMGKRSSTTSKQQVLALGEPLPCCAYVWPEYCGKPAVMALGEPVATAYGHWWKIMPLCDVHQVIAQREAVTGKQAVVSTTP